MKTNKILVMALLLAISGGTFTSCAIKDNEKHSEMVEDPIQATTEYYINGKVLDSYEKALKDVTVTAGENASVKTDATGNFSLTVDAVGDYTVNASLDGYLKVSGSVTVPQDAANRQSFNTSFIMTKKATAVTIAADNTDDVIISTAINDKVGSMTAVQTGLAVAIPATNADVKGSSISVTEYVPEVSAANIAAQEAPVANIYVETSKDIAANGITLAVANQASADESFEAMTVYKSTVTRSGDNFKEIGSANLNTASNKYEITLDGDKLAGDYSFRVKYKSTATTGKETQWGEEDNSGSLNAIKNYKISYKEKTGWMYTDDKALQNLNSETKKMIQNAIKACEGAEGVVETTKSQTTNISGNHILYYTVENNYTVTTYTFTMKGGKNITVKTKAYTGTKLTYKMESADQHSGGTANGI